MATTGWLGEQELHRWGGYNTRFTTNVYVNSIKRYSDHIDVNGTIYLYCKSDAQKAWYDWNITSWSMGNNLGQIKERTYLNNIKGRTWTKGFNVRINCSNSATSATFNAGFSDANMGGKDRYWTIYFDKYAIAPSGIKSTATYTQYTTITTSCSNINWGQGYSSRTLTCVATYQSGGKTQTYTLGTWTDGATSKTVTKNNFVFLNATQVTITWTATTNVGSSKSTSYVNVQASQTLPSGMTCTANYFQYQTIESVVSNINWGRGYSQGSTKAECIASFTYNGKTTSWTIGTWTDGGTRKVATKTDCVFPADVTVTMKWNISTNLGTTTISKQISVKSTYPIPDLKNVTVTAESTGPYAVTTRIERVNFGYNYTKRNIKCYIVYDYDDGVHYENLIGEKDNNSNWTFNYDASSLAQPWKMIPEDFNAQIKYVIDNGNGVVTKTAPIYCQPQYEAYIIEYLSENEKKVTPAILKTNDKVGTKNFKEVRRVGTIESE